MITIHKILIYKEERIVVNNTGMFFRIVQILIKGMYLKFL